MIHSLSSIEIFQYFKNYREEFDEERREREQEDQERDLERQEEIDQKYGDSYKCMYFCGEKRMEYFDKNYKQSHLYLSQRKFNKDCPKFSPRMNLIRESRTPRERQLRKTLRQPENPEISNKIRLFAKITVIVSNIYNNTFMKQMCETIREKDC